MKETIENYYRIPGAIQTGKESNVSIEDLLMNLATAEITLKELSIRNHSLESGEFESEPVDGWAISAAFVGLNKVKHALKCGLYGYDQIHLHQ